MSSTNRRMIVGTLLNATGLHLAGWRFPSVEPSVGRELEHYARLAKTAEAARLDFIFLADSLATMYGSSPKSLKRIAPLNEYEPISLLSALAAVTSRIGLIGSATTTYNEPFHIARQFASLDIISSGRAGWNVVTSLNPDEAHNFGHHQPIDLPARYERANEFVDATQALWDSWEDDALVYDKEEGIYFDPEKVHEVGHRGTYFSVRGPSTIPRSPQGRPLIVQSGSSDMGRQAGARFADLIFTAQQSLPEAQAFYRDIKSRVEKANRAPDRVKIIPGIVPFLGATEAEARDKFELAQSLIHPDVGLSLLGQLLGEIDLSIYPVDGPLPPLPQTPGKSSRVEMLLEVARRENLSIRELYLRAAAGARGHWTVHGTAKHIADVLEEWFLNEGADGFAVIPPFLPEGLSDVANLLVPELRRRGLFPHTYEHTMLRDNLGLRHTSQIRM